MQVAPRTVQFLGSARSDGDAPVAYTYAWDFGDGASSAEQSPSHVYAETGAYTVTLRVTDTAGNTLAKTLSVDVGM